VPTLQVGQSSLLGGLGERGLAEEHFLGALPEVFEALDIAGFLFTGSQFLQRANTFVREGVAERLPEGGIRLLKAPRSNEPARTDPIDNQCARCGALKGLSTS
jgi:hypothetical protein